MKCPSSIILILGLFAFVLGGAFSTFGQATYINEDFSTGSITTPPSGWVVNVISGNPSIDLWHFDNPGGRVINAPLTNPVAIFDSDNYSNNGLFEDVELESPAFDASAASNVTLEWDEYFWSCCGSIIYVEIFNGSSWIQIYTEASSTNNPVHQVVDVSAYAAGVSNAKVRFRWTGSWAMYWIVDNVTVLEKPANDYCVSATNVTADLNSGSCSSYTTVAATNSYRSSCDTNYCAGGTVNNINNNVWFSFVAPSTGDLTVTIDGYSWNTPNYDPIVALYSSCDSTTQVFCSPITGDGSDQDGIKTASFTGLLSGNTYYLNVDPPCSATGIFCLKLDYLSHCLNGIQDYDELGLDCGGVQCASCVLGGATFQRAFGGASSEFGYSVSQTSDGGYIVGGYTSSYGQGSNDLYLVKTNGLGDTLWTKTYGGTSIENGYKVKQTSDAGYVMVGTTQMGPGGQSIYVLKLNSVGDSVWARAYGGVSTDYAGAVVQTPDNGYVIAGSTFNQGAGSSDGYVFKVDGIGDTLWSRSYGGTSSEYFQDIKQTADGGFILTGSTQSFGAGGVDVYLVKIDSVGDTLWTRAFGSTLTDYGQSVIEVSTGGYLIAGYTQMGAGTYAFYLVRTDVSGNSLWSKTYGGTASDMAYSVIENSSGDFVVVGNTTSFGFGVKDVFFIKVSSSGALIIAKTFGGTLDDEANSIGLTSDGGYIICGNTRNFSGSDQKMYLIKTDSDGMALGCMQSSTSTTEGTPVTLTGSTNTIVTTVDTGMTFNLVNSNATPTLTGVYGPGLGIALNGSTVTCFNGSDGQATADISCAAAPFSYLWSDGQTTATATGLSAGTYQVVVTDSMGTIDSNTIAIFQAAIIDPTLTAAYQICTGSDGNISSFTTGGTGSYTYSWSNGDSVPSIGGLSAAMYTVTITDAVGCSATDSAEVTLHIDVLNISFVSTTVICDGVCNGTLDANVTGGTFPYAYSWNDPSSQSTDLAVGLCPVTHTVTVTDTYGCIGVDSATVSVIPMPIQSICMITVDTTSTKNLIVWEKPISAGIDYYKVYREVSTNNYTLVGTVPYGNLSEFVDTTYGVSPSTTSYRYKVSLVDTCGVETALSTSHKTIHMIISLDISSKPVLQWNDYEGVTIVNYRILRDSTGTNSWQVIDSVPFGVNSWTDINPPGGPNLVYMVEIVLPSTCTSTKIKNYNSSISNSLVKGAGLVATANAMDATPANCDGTVTVAANFGLLPYTYSWSTPLNDSTNFVDSLCQGTYTVTVTDGSGDTATATVTVFQPNSMSAGVSSTNPTISNCDGALTVNASAGLPPYTYVWNTTPVQTTTTIDSLCQGTYSVTVYDFGGDSTSLSVTITETAAPMSGVASTVDATLSICDGSATASVSGGITPYTYVWSTSPAQTSITADSLCAGSYDVTVYDNAGDSVVISLTIIEVAAPMSGSTSTTSANQGFCDGNASVTASGGVTPYTYLWNSIPAQTSSTADSLCAGSYDVTVYDSAGDSIVLMVTILEIIPPLSGSTSTTSANQGFCDGIASVTVGGGVSPYTYLWNSIPAQTSATADSLCAGSYDVTVYDTTGDSIVLSVTILEIIPPLSGSTSTTSATFGNCDGTANLTVSGGTPAYTYIWSSLPSESSATADSLCQGTYSITVFDALGDSIVLTVSITETGSPMSGTTSTTSASQGNCDGTASVVASGGATPYTYLWNTTPAQTTDTASGLCAGAYDVTVYDGTGDSIVLMVTIVENIPPMSGSSSATSTTQGNCEGTASVSVTGGAPPYTYLWNTSPAQSTAMVDSLCQGTYNVTVYDGSGDSIVLIATVVEVIPPMSGTTNTTSATIGNCDGTASVTISGGTVPYTYLWNDSLMQTSDTAVGLCPGSYDVVVIDSNGDSITLSVVVTGSTLPLSGVASSTNATFGNCDGTASVVASGGVPPYTYLWNDSLVQTTATAVGLCAGIYNVTILDGSGSNVVVLPVTVGSTGAGPSPVADFIASQVSIIVGQSIDYLDLTSNSPTSWTWIFSGASPSFSTVQNPTSILYNTVGCFDAQLSATNMAGTDTIYKSCYIEVLPVSISELQNITDVIVYPNPSEGVFSIQIHSSQPDKYNLIVRDLLGREIYISTFGNSIGKTNIEKTIDLSEQPVGIYELVIFTGDQKIVRKLMVK